MTSEIRELSMDKLESVSGGDGINYLVAVSQIKANDGMDRDFTTKPHPASR
jgi:hypothetical protein